LDEGDPWIQESITGSRFSARFMWDDRTEGRILPVITGSATVVGRGDLFIGRDEVH
jgi:proline racemase